jgi:two-component system CheB/CheR fusion protein
MSEQHDVDVRERLLIRESNHRVRNMLQVVIGLATQTIRRSKDLAAFERTYFERLQALARSYELLARECWRNVSLADLLTMQLAAVVADRSRYSLAGEDIVIKPTAALSLGLVVHELAMNAYLHGAFAPASGRIAIRWEVADACLQQDWEECGCFVRPTDVDRLGCELVTRQLQHELRGNAALDFTDTGLVARLSIPCAELR